MSDKKYKHIYNFKNYFGMVGVSLGSYVQSIVDLLVPIQMIICAITEFAH